MSITSALPAALQAIRCQAPLIHSITNLVTMQWTANCLLALGASPVMAHAKEEVTEMLTLAKALVINIGTLSPSWFESMQLAMQQAVAESIPIVLDPVGAGATRYRTQAVHDLLATVTPYPRLIIRGNAAEIFALDNQTQLTKGVDSLATAQAALPAAKQIVQRYAATVCISGTEDYIVSSQQTLRIGNGHPLMSKVTGMGCAATSVTAAYASVEKDLLLAAALAMATMGVAGELTAKQCRGVGSFQMHFLDVLYTLQGTDIKARLDWEAI